MFRLGGFNRRPWITNAAYTGAITIQIACTVHLINEHVLEVRNSTGASMLPTLAPEGDFLLQLRLPFTRFLDSIATTFARLSPVEDGSKHPYYNRGRKNIGGGGFSKSDQAQGTGLKIGDLVVALSPFDPSRSVCKRVIGLPGDTVCLDPRMRPLPEHAWRGRKALEQPQAKRGVNAEDAGGDELGGKLVKFEDLLASLGATKSSAASPSFEKNILVDGEVDLLKSMDTDPHLTPDTSEADTIAHNTAAASEITQHTYIRSKGDVQYVTVPLGHVWLAGDNMGNSTDSRHYGPVPLGMVRGKVLARVWPSPRWLTNKLTFVD